ncbi:unnamed protein product, partial [Polarella glacialis]
MVRGRADSTSSRRTLPGFQTVKDLVLRGADVNAADCAAWSPLHVRNPRTRQPASPRAREPANSPRTRAPTHPCTREPAKPQSREARSREPVKSRNHEAADPRNDEPATREPTNPQTREHANPHTREPVNPRTRETCEPATPRKQTYSRHESQGGGRRGISMAKSKVSWRVAVVPPRPSERSRWSPAAVDYPYASDGDSATSVFGLGDGYQAGAARAPPVLAMHRCMSDSACGCRAAPQRRAPEASLNGFASHDCCPPQPLPQRSPTTRSEAFGGSTGSRTPPSWVAPTKTEVSSRMVSRLPRSASTGSCNRRDAGSETGSDWPLQAHLESLRMEQQAVHARCHRAELLIEEKVRSLRTSRDRLANEEAQLQQRQLQLQMALRAQEQLRRAGDIGRQEAECLAQCAASEGAAQLARRSQLEEQLSAQLREAERRVQAMEAAGQLRLQEIIAEGAAGLRRAAQLGRKHTELWGAETEAAAAQSAQEARLQVLWDERLETNLFAKSQLGQKRTEDAELKMQQRAQQELAQEQKRLEEVQLKARTVLQEGMQNEEFTWLAKMRPVWQAESQHAMAEVRCAELEVQRQESRMRAWCTEEVEVVSAREEASAEAWLARVSAAAEAQAESETNSVRAACSRLEKSFTADQPSGVSPSKALEQPSPASQAAESRLAQREEAWRQRLASAQRLGEESVALYRSESLEAQRALAALEASRQAPHEEQLASAEALHQARCEASFTEGLEAVQSGAAREAIFADRLSAAERSRDDALRHAAELQRRSAELRKEELAATAMLEEKVILHAEERREALLGRHRAMLGLDDFNASNVSFASSIGAVASTAMMSPPPGVPPGSARKVVPTTGVRDLRGDWSSDYVSLHSARKSLTSEADAPRQDSYYQLRVATSHGSTFHLVSCKNPVIEGSPRSLTRSRSSSLPIPPVYQAAIQAVETYGWEEIHPTESAEWTALHWAASAGQLEVCSRLLAAAADPRQPDHTGKSALQYAREAGHLERGAFDERLVQDLPADLSQCAGEEGEIMSPSESEPGRGLAADQQMLWTNCRHCFKWSLSKWQCPAVTTARCCWPPHQFLAQFRSWSTLNSSLPLRQSCSRALLERQAEEELESPRQATLTAVLPENAPTSAAQREAGRIYVTVRGTLKKWSGRQLVPVCGCPWRRSPVFGLPDDERPTCCAQCKSANMVDIENQKCKCSRGRPGFGFRDKKRPTCCAQCKSLDMVDMKNQKCKCGRSRPCFGCHDDEMPTCCNQCKSPDMVNIVSKKCKCGRSQPYFGFPDAERPTCCAQCKSADMVDIRNRKCKCGKSQPGFGFRDDKRPTCCAQCKSSDMVDIKSKMCKCGRSRPSSGFPDDARPTCCAKCRSPDMVDKVSRRCVVCGIFAAYPDSKGFPKRLCAQHSADVGAHRLSPPREEISGLVAASRVQPDGYHPGRREVWEFFGNYFHGYPPGHPEHSSVCVGDQPASKLYESTMARNDLLLGSERVDSVLYIWEHDFLSWEAEGSDRSILSIVRQHSYFICFQDCRSLSRACSSNRAGESWWSAVTAPLPRAAAGTADTGPFLKQLGVLFPAVFILRFGLQTVAHALGAGDATAPALLTAILAGSSMTIWRAAEKEVDQHCMLDTSKQGVPHGDVCFHLGGPSWELASLHVTLEEAFGMALAIAHLAPVSLFENWGLHGPSGYRWAAVVAHTATAVTVTIMSYHFTLRTLRVQTPAEGVASQVSEVWLGLAAGNW